MSCMLDNDDLDDKPPTLRDVVREIAWLAVCLTFAAGMIWLTMRGPL